MAEFDAFALERAMLKERRRLWVILTGLALFALLSIAGNNSWSQPPPSVAVQFQNPQFSVNEDTPTKSATILVTISPAPATNVTVDYATIAGGTATDPGNYTAKSGTLTFLAGQSNPQSFPISINNDQLSTGNLTVFLALTNPTGGASLGPTSTATLTIIDKQMATFSQNAITVNVGATVPLATVNPANAQNIKIESMNKGIAIVEGASPTFSVKGVAQGTTGIMVTQGPTTIGGVSVNVTQPVVTATFPPPNPLAMNVGATVKLKVDIQPSDAQNISFKSDKTSVTTVAGTAAELAITGVAQGSANIIAMQGTNPIGGMTVNVTQSPYSIQLASDKTTILAGGKNSPPHQTTITATLLDPVTGMPVQQAGVLVTFGTSGGTVNPAVATTDATGKATATLTSNNIASSATTKFNATVSAQAGGNPATINIEFQAPQLTLVASPTEIEIGETATLTLQAKWNLYPVDQHALRWRIAKLWDADGNLIYDGVGEPPSGYGYIFAASSPTDLNGVATAMWRGTSPGTVRFEARDEDVFLAGAGEKPTGTSGDEKTKGDATGKSGLADIYNGQFGKKVDEDKESTVGAFTAANLNDTNGDGIPDNDAVKNKSVKALNLGRDELDLMAFVIHPQAPVENQKIKLSVVKGSIKFWKKSTKEEEETATEFAPDKKPRMLWIEATKASGEVRDIEIKVEYNGTSNTIKATAVWATLTAVAHDTLSDVKLFEDANWKDTPTPPKDSITQFGGAGLRPPSKDGVRNVIVIRFTVSPPKVASEPGVFFDITRQAQSVNWSKKGDKVTVIYNDRPLKDLPVELANDDESQDDESEAPDKNDHLYVMDAPGKGSEDTQGEEIAQYRMNAREFVRVRFDGNRPVGNGEVGSRVSAYYDWHVRHYLTAKNGKWIRPKEDNTNETDLNDIGPNHIDLGTIPK